MTQMPPDEQLRRLLARHDRLLAETAQQNRDLHEWAVRYGPRPVAPAEQQGAPSVPSFSPGAPSVPSFSPGLPAGPVPDVSPGLSGPAVPDSSPRPSAASTPGWAPPVQAPSFPPPTASTPSRPAGALSTTQVVARVLAGLGALVTLVGIAF
ncbi:MAG TPA: hypothetical protein VFK68_08310, partial [Propionibacteriaceae bacterium]|nr:hypothetical protein [Propionibacteriaceae bacterium]